LKGLSSSERKDVLAAAKARQIVADKTIVRQDDPAHEFFLLTAGQARYFYISEEGHKILLLRLVPGDVFGAAAILSEPSRYLVGTETVRESKVLVWKRPVIKALVGKYPELMQNAFHISYGYLGWYVATHVGLTCHTASHRFASVLVTLAHTVGQRVSSGIELEATNEELANAAAITPFTASRLMSRWQRSGAIMKKRGNVVIRFPERLFTPNKRSD
jgi:CRP/FNR family transcriptional regulator, nitrogen oxide reductase regulator